MTALLCLFDDILDILVSGTIVQDDNAQYLYQNIFQYHIKNTINISQLIWLPVKLFILTVYIIDIPHIFQPEKYGFYIYPIDAEVFFLPTPESEFVS